MLISTFQSQDALRASIDASHLDQRAWVGLADFATIGGTETIDHKGFSFKTVQIDIRNSGKTPAINPNVVTLVTPWNWSDKIEDIDTLAAKEKQKLEEQNAKQLEKEIRRGPQSADMVRELKKSMEEMGSLPNGQVLAPESIIAVNTVGEYFGNLQGGTPKYVYILGKITYNDIFDGSHCTPQNSA